MEQAAHDQAASGGIGLGEYRIYPERPLPGLSSGANAAYHAASVAQPNQVFCALVWERVAFRLLDIMPIVRKVGSTTLITPLAWQVIDWPPNGRRNLAIVFDKPAGGRFVNSPGATTTPVSEDTVVRDYLVPIVSALHALATAGIVHGAVNPANIMFGEAPRQQVVLGECVSAPRALSHALSANVEAAVPIVRSRDFDTWAQRALGDETGIALVKAALQEGAPGGPSPQRDAALVARICIALDWQAPVRYRDLAAPSDGVGGALAKAVIEQGPVQTIIEAIGLRVPQFWLSARNPPAGGEGTPPKLFACPRGVVDALRACC